MISGDNPTTVGAIATEVGLDAGTPRDARELGETPEDLADAVATTTVFGRVSPKQKQAMVRALQAEGHVVAMTGDGVNDALALKDADIGVAMGNGAPATRAAAQLVLLDGQFSRLPNVLAEGRRVIGNIERVASLFISKNTYAFLLILLVSIAGLPYPFAPRHLTLISAVTIGIPAFALKTLQIVVEEIKAGDEFVVHPGIGHQHRCRGGGARGGDFNQRFGGHFEAFLQGRFAPLPCHPAQLVERHFALGSAVTAH